MASLDPTVLGDKLQKTRDVTCMTMDAHGYLCVCTKSVLFLISPTGWHVLLAGHKSETGFRNGNGADARFNNPRGIALDGDNNVLLADTGNHALRKITRTGVVTTVAGSGKKGYADGVGTASQFHSPWGIVVDEHGTIFVADRDNHCLRKVAPGDGTCDGTVSTLAGTGEERGWSATHFNFPRGLALDADSNLIVADSGNHCIRRVTTDSEPATVTTVAGRAERREGERSEVAGRAERRERERSEAFPACEAADALFNRPCGIAVFGNNVLVADTNNNRIRFGVCLTYTHM
jgi:sugar lactone lactonase YvrE